MGSPFRLVLYASDPDTARILAQKSFALVDSLNAVFSDYAPDSELNRLCALSGSDSAMAVSSLFYKMIRDCQIAWKKSKGRFDITVGPLSRLWRNSRKERTFPAPDAVQHARQRTGFENVWIDTSTKTIKLIKAGMQLDLGGIAKGYIAQRVVDFAQTQGAAAALADAGGDIVCGAPPPGKEGWTIGVNRPGQDNALWEKNLVLHNRAVATSGDLYQYTLHNGKKYSHIIHPQTGYGVTFQRNVTVLAKTGSTADWLATACSLLPVAKAKRLARKEKAQLFITQLAGDRLKHYGTRGMKRYWKR